MAIKNLQMQEVVLTRKELYDLAWSESLTALSKKYKISYVDFRKICEKLDIPLPGSGYWTKLKFNKKVVVIPLSNTYEGETTLIISITEDGATNNIVPAKPIKQMQKRIEKEVNEKITMPAKLTHPDKLIVAARETLNNRAKGRWGAGILSTDRDQIRIAVTAGLIARALRFMDTLVKNLRKRGHNILLKNDETYVIVEGTEIKIGLRERSVRVPPPDNRGTSDYKPTGIVYLKIDYFLIHKEWDDKRTPLEEQIANIIAKLETVGRNGRLEREENQRWWAEQREKKRIEEGREARKEKELKDFKDLLNKAKRFDEVRQLRDYIAVVEEKASINGTVADDLSGWVDWARKKADWYDPLIEREDELLDNGFRTNLEYKKKSGW